MLKQNFKGWFNLLECGPYRTLRFKKRQKACRPICNSCHEHDNLCRINLLTHNRTQSPKEERSCEKYTVKF